MILFDGLYEVVRVNEGGALFLALVGIDEPVGANIMRMLLAEAVRELLSNWEEVAGDILRRV